MVGLEKRLRESLIEQRADELFNQFSSEPQYKEMVCELVKESIKDFLTSFGDIDATDEILANHLVDLETKMKSQYDDPKQLRSMLIEQARKDYMTFDEFKLGMISKIEGLENMVGAEKGIKDFKLSDVVTNNLEKFYGKLSEYVQENERIIDRLTEIAGKEGLEKAIQKETRYEIIREKFTTSESFREYFLKARENKKYIFTELSNAFIEGSEIEQIIGEMIKSSFKSIEKMTEIQYKLGTDYFNKTIQEIYK